MKKIRKVIAALMALCLLCPCITMVAYAASAQLRFTDPSTVVGDEVAVTAKLTSASNIQSAEATLTYDTSMLKFISGENASGGDGTITLSGSGGSKELSFALTFQALAEGTAKVEVSQVSGTASDGSSLQVTNGSSAVTIGPGDPSKITNEGDNNSGGDGTGVKVTVGDAGYVISGDFTDAVVPTGFAKSEMTFEGANCQVIKQDTSDVVAMFLVPEAGGEGDFFLYDSDKGTFSPFESVDISQQRYIVLLSDESSVKLPKAYQKTTLTLNGKDFPAWQNTEESDYYVVHALNSDGQKNLYQYDTVDGTYQRYLRPSASDSTDSTAPAKGLWGKITQFLKNHMDLFVIGVWVVLLILLIILIVVAVKLRHRNIEIDDLYDEYGIDVEDEEEEAPRTASKKDMKPAVRKPMKKQHNEDDFDDFEEEDLEEDDLDNTALMFEDDDFDDDDYEEEFYEEQIEEDYDNSDYDDSEIEDLDALLGEKPRKKRGHMEDDDTFKVDFIDLD